jgi:negative regulator of sigma E activity
MNNDEAPDRAEQASAYLDGELDTVERAAASADPDTMALVDSFTRVRDGLGSIEPVSEDIRFAAIAAALAEYDALRSVHVTAPATAMAAVTMLRPRWLRAYRVLGAVAAAAVIAVIGIAALNSSGSDSKSMSAATSPAAQNDTAGEAQRTESAAGSVAPAGAALPAAAAPSTTVGATQKALALVPAVDNSADLAQYAATLAAAADASVAAATSGGYASASTPAVPAPETPSPSCLASTDALLGPITVLGSPAFAVRDMSSGVVKAIDAGDCRVLFTTGP